MSALKKLAGETVIYGVSSIVGRFLNYFLTPLYAWTFLPDEFGILSNILAYVAFLQVVLTYGMETSYFRFAGRSENPDKVFTTSMVSLGITSVAFVILVLGFSRNIANWISYEGHQNYIIWMGITVALDTLCAIPFAKLRLKSRPLKFAFLKLVNITLSIFLNVFWIYLCPKILQSNPDSFIQYIYNPRIGIGYAFLSYLVASAITLLFFIFDLKIKKSNFDGKLLRQMLIYGWPILVIGVAGMVNLQIDKILLPKLIVGSDNPIFELGVYSANSKLAILMMLFIQAFRFSFEPFLFSHYKNEDSKKIYAVIMKYFVILGLLIFLGVMFYMDILKFFIGSSKSGYHEGIKVVPWLLMGNLFLGIFYTQSLWYKLTDKTHFGARFAIIGAIITIVLNVLFIPVLGYMACGYAFFAASFVMTVISYIVGQKYFPVKYDLKRIGTYFLVAMALYLIEINVVFTDKIVRISFNTSLLMIFFLFIWVKENADLKRLFSLQRK
ncbi:MAG: polysaccharide biosynthesis C-terminal domain-containing protein [Bacteroidia bacterium]|nr:polysaccharide biosynthesis C-terminal domain-containing protein [Bacteroidia bacterium]